MSETHHITVDPGQCGGRPCLRIRVRDVPDLLEQCDITAAIEYAARQSDHPKLRVA